MPFTILHYPIAFELSKTDRRLPLPGLIVGSVLPDIEVPIMWVFFSNLPDHLVLHSLIGALTLGTLLAILITRYVYPPFMSTLFDVDQAQLAEKCRITPSLILSCMLGLTFHVLFDYLMHPNTRLFYPLIDSSFPGPLVQLFAFGGDIKLGYFIAIALTSAVMLILWIRIIIKYKGPDLWNQLWVGKEMAEISRN